MKRINLIKAFYLSIILIPLFIIGYVFLAFKSGKQNIKNCEGITAGMSEPQVIEIMGKPEQILRTTDSRTNKSLVDYMYSPPPMASSGVDIFFDSNMVVIKTVCID